MSPTRSCRIVEPRVAHVVYIIVLLLYVKQYTEKIRAIPGSLYNIYSEFEKFISKYPCVSANLELQSLFLYFVK